MDAEDLRVKALDAYRQGPDAIVALVAGLVTELAARPLEEENATLRARLARNSRNGSQPPSSDGPAANWATRATPCGWWTTPARSSSMRLFAVRRADGAWRTPQRSNGSAGR